MSMRDSVQSSTPPPGAGATATGAPASGPPVNRAGDNRGQKRDVIVEDPMQDVEL